ncbi:MAG: hypothetical protein CMO01_26000 [Thalassobius sp.]|nr:hypothetical protein [Thalassovita sp.]
MEQSRERNLQFDFFRNNGQVLFQVFKQSDVKKWEVKFDLDDGKGFIIIMIFNRSKIDNTSVFDIFQKNAIFKHFHKIDFYKQNTYYMNFPSSSELFELNKVINNLINEIFEIDDLGYYYTMNAY